MSKVIGLTCLHYGKPYLAAAMQSIVDAVDEYWVLYAPNPSHNGGVAALLNPDTEDELRAIAQTVAGKKLNWIRGTWRYENEQRNAIYDLVPDADVIVVADYDEIYADALAHIAVAYALQSSARHIRLPFNHLWRSFQRGFLHDPAYPIRVINPKRTGDTVTMPIDRRVWHTGYAIPVEYMRYKWSGIHGHQSELRRDVNWLEDVYVANRQTDAHPVGSDWWNTEHVPRYALPTPLRYHPYIGLDLIP